LFDGFDVFVDHTILEDFHAVHALVEMTALFAGELATGVNKGPDKGYWDMLWSSPAFTLDHPESHTSFSQAHTLPWLQVLTPFVC